MTQLPRTQNDLIGHEEAEQQLLQAASSGRLPHAWLIAGSEGIGKATLAYRFARFLLSGRKEGKNLDVPPSDIAAKLVAAGSHPDLLVLEREMDEKKGRMEQNIPAERAREIANFLHLTASQSGKRIAIVDGASHLNRFGQNALLKILEEPPKNSLIILTSESVGALLPTIRSRCRVVQLNPLTPQQLRIIAQRSDIKLDDPKALEFFIDLAEGSAARLFRYAENDAHMLYQRWQSFLMQPADRLQRLRLAEACAGRDSEETFLTLRDIVFITLRREIDARARGEVGLAANIPLNRLLTLWDSLKEKANTADHGNLDNKTAFLNMMDEAAGVLAAAA
jgi:DNA polymerase-3 subunit delta'